MMMMMMMRLNMKSQYSQEKRGLAWNKSHSELDQLPWI